VTERSEGTIECRPVTAAGGLALACAAAILVTLAGVLGRVRRHWMIVVVEGPSMAPSLVAGDRIRVRRVPPETVHIGDVVVAVRPAPGPRRLIVKRVAAVPGDPAPPGVAPGAEGAGAHVPPGRYLLLGDNPADSYDSRVFGYVPAEHILGVARRHRREHVRLT
jgi:signal peptidase I